LGFLALWIASKPMMEAVFKANEGDRDKEISKIIFEIEQHELNLLRFDQQRFISGELEADSYNA
jgi:hypothetical protein